MPRLSENVMRMTTLDRTKQELSDYIDKVNICVDIHRSFNIHDKIIAECEKRNIPYESVCTRELKRDEPWCPFGLDLAQYHIKKICLSRSVPALKKKLLVDWVVKRYNKNYARKNNEPHSDNYCVWIQPDGDVETWSSEDEKMRGLAHDRALR